MSKSKTIVFDTLVTGKPGAILNVRHYDVKTCDDSINYPILEENPYTRYKGTSYRVVSGFGHLTKKTRAYPGYPLTGISVEEQMLQASCLPTDVGNSNVFSTYFSDIGSLEQALINATLNKGYDVGRADAGTIIGELAETRKMVAKRTTQFVKFISNQLRSPTCENLRKTTRSLRITNTQSRSNLKKATLSKAAARHIKDISDNWLEMSFGWLPFVSDVEQMAEYLASEILNEEEFVVRKTFNREIPRQVLVSPYNFRVKSKCYASDAVKLRLRCTLHINYANSSYTNYAEYLRGRFLRKVGLDPNQVILVGYELIPYSWLVDYVANVGDMLRYKFDPLPISSGSLSRRITFSKPSVGGSFVGTGTNTSATAEYHGTITELWHRYSDETFRYQRSAMTSSQYQGTFQLADFSAKHLANVTALLESRTMGAILGLKS